MSSSQDGQNTLGPGYPPLSLKDAYEKAEPLKDLGEVVREQPSRDMSKWQAGDFLSALMDATGYSIEQKIHVLDVAIGWNSQCDFAVRNQKGDNIFYVKEVSNMCCRQCCRAINAFKLEFKGRDGQDLFYVERGFNCSSCFALICPDNIRVCTADGELIGTVKETPHIFYPNFKLENPLGNRVLEIEGPFCPMICTICRGDITFSVRDWKQTEVGTIRKDWTNFPQELFSSADNYSISFAADLEPSTKCLLLAALFMINYEFFESDHGKPALIGFAVGVKSTCG